MLQVWKMVEKFRGCMLAKRTLDTTRVFYNFIYFVPLYILLNKSSGILSNDWLLLDTAWLKLLFIFQNQAQMSLFLLPTSPRPLKTPTTTLTQYILIEYLYISLTH